MSRRAKLIEALRNNPKDFRFDDACKVAEWLGFSHRKRGASKGRNTSHCVFVRRGEETALNFQDCGGKIPAYQARQLIEMVNKYEDEL
jgi:hypothetical protein